MTEMILEIQAIHTFIGQFHILEGVSVTVPRGSITVLWGRNGAGKTTTLRSIMGLLQPAQDSILFDGQPLARNPLHNRANGDRVRARTPRDF